MKRLIALLPLMVALCLYAAVSIASAQDQTITDDQVNAIAKKLYCPVCENITLDTCGTAACADWRDEIRLQLEAGHTEDQIITDFVQRFGDRVVGTPQDSVLRALSLVTPWIMIAGVLVILGKMYISRQRGVPVTESPSPSDDSRPTQKYHDLLERDLEG